MRRSRAPARVSVDTLDALEEVLIMADVGVGATADIVKAVGSRARRGESLRDLVKAEIRGILAAGERRPGRCTRRRRS